VLVAANSRAAPSPDPVDLSAMTQIKSADIKVASNRWHTLGWRAEGSCFTVFFDGKELFSTGDKTFNAEVAPIDCGSCRRCCTQRLFGLAAARLVAVGAAGCA